MSTASCERALSPAFPRRPRSTAHRLGRVALICVALGMLAVGVRMSHAQSVPQGPGLGEPSPAEGRDFEVERKAIEDSRAWTNYRFSAAEHECYSKFFVMHCIDKAKEVQRGELAVLRKRELEVGDAERAYKADRRDRDAAVRQAAFEANQPTRTANEQAARADFERKQQAQQLRDAQKGSDAPQRAANAEAYGRKQAEFNARVKAAQDQAAADARQRQENVKAYDTKQSDAVERQKELDERRAKAKEGPSSGGTPSPFGF